MKKIFSIFAVSAVFTGVFGLIAAADAQTLDTGLNVVNNTIQLGSQGPITIIAQIINIAMIFLGSIAVIVCLFAGFRWMTAQGNAEQVAEAQTILRNGVIGLLIILSSWGIAAFIISRFTGASLGGGPNGQGNGTFGQTLGLGAIGACSVQDVYPQPDQKEVPRNTSLIVTFKEAVKLDTVCIDSQTKAACACGAAPTCDQINPKNIRIFVTSTDDACKSGTCVDPNTNITAVTVKTTPDNKTFIMTPQNYLGSPSDYVWYSAYFSNDISKASDGKGIFDTCSVDYLRWQFQVSNKVDLTPPQVSDNGVFPLPDTGRDTPDAGNSVTAQQASGKIEVTGKPAVYQAASVASVKRNPTIATWNDAQAQLDGNYHDLNTEFIVTAMSDTKASLKLADGTSLGLATLSNGALAFAHYFTLNLQGDGQMQTGNSWRVTVNPEVKADTLQVGNDIYTFVSGTSTGFSIHSFNSYSQSAAEIAAVLSGSPDLEIDFSNETVNVKAKQAGVAGNDILLAATGDALKVTPLSGGRDKHDAVKVNGAPDQPMNSTIQINFNESINPITISGSATDLKDIIRIINADSNSAAAGASCNGDNDCRSFKCVNTKCVGDVLDGHFAVSNNYQTVEFISANECGVNGCGGKIYCLPGNSQIRVELQAASLQVCASSADCVTKSPFSQCLSNHCQDSNGANYPVADAATVNGVMDANLNSLDGNRDGKADGPVSFYDENVKNAAYKDNFRWSFFISNRLEIGAPTLTYVDPTINASGADLNADVNFVFDKLMMKSSLQTGTIDVASGTSTVTHKLINLMSTSPTGYWIESDNHYTAGTPDYTQGMVKHSVFDEGVSYKAQIGSGVKDIYQNCFKPSAFKPSTGAGCAATDFNPSCCNGTPTDTLGADGNCAN
jgi:hypothetical protein